MKSNTVRRLVVATAAGALGLGALVTGAPVVAATANLDYSCAIADNYNLQFTFNQDTNAPAKIYLGRTKTPTYIANTTLPDQAVGLARFFGVTSFDGAIDATVLVNGSKITVHAPIKKTKVPASGGIVLKATGPTVLLAAVTPKKFVFKPSTILFTVNAYKADKSTLFSVKKAKCTMPANKKTIDTVAFAKSPTTTTATATYAKASKQVTAVATVKAASGLKPTGKLTAVLYKGTKKIKTVSGNLSSYRATATFPAITQKGAYKVVLTYAGSLQNLGSTVTKTFTVS